MPDGPDPLRSQGGEAAQMPRPQNAWTLYRSDKLREITALNPAAPQLPRVEISKLISAGWKNEREEVRGHYKCLADIKNAEHQRLYPKYQFRPMTRTEKQQFLADKMRAREQVPADKKRSREQVSADKERIREQFRADEKPSRVHVRADPHRIPEQVPAHYEPPDSVCDVCAEEFGPHNPPKSLPCGHILCGSCIVIICEKTPRRCKPCCPFCRETFDSDTVRSVPVDHEAAKPKAPPTHWQVSLQSVRDAAFRIAFEEFKANEASRIRADVQRLEDKAVNIASTSSSVAELNSICNELEDWLSRECNMVPEGEHISLLMSAALLRSILNERSAHTKPSNVPKSRKLTSTTG